MTLALTMGKEKQADSPAVKKRTEKKKDMELACRRYGRAALIEWTGGGMPGHPPPGSMSGTYDPDGRSLHTATSVG